MFQKFPSSRLIPIIRLTSRRNSFLLKEINASCCRKKFLKDEPLLHPYQQPNASIDAFSLTYPWTRSLAGTREIRDWVCSTTVPPAHSQFGSSGTVPFPRRLYGCSRQAPRTPYSSPERVPTEASSAVEVIRMLLFYFRCQLVSIGQAYRGIHRPLVVQTA